MRKLLKRVLPVVLSLAMAMTLLVPLASAHPTSGKCGKNVKWSLNPATDTLTISGKGAMYNYDYEDTAPWQVPPEADEAEIEAGRFDKVVIKKGVTSIGSCAFADCNLKSISLPATLTKIGRGAFFNCEGISTFTLPKKVKTVGEDTFHGFKVKAYKVAKGSKYFSAKDGVLFNKAKTVLVAYPEMRKNKSYTVPKSVKTVRAYAFAGDEAGISGNHYLNKLVLQSKLTKVERFAFADCNVSTYQFKGKAPKFNKYAFLDDSAVLKYPKKYKSSWKKVKSQLVDADLTFKAV